MRCVLDVCERHSLKRLFEKLFFLVLSLFFRDDNFTQQLLPSLFSRLGRAFLLEPERLFLFLWDKTKCTIHDTKCFLDVGKGLPLILSPFLNNSTGCR